jgi:hypothetical protein
MSGFHSLNAGVLIKQDRCVAEDAAADFNLMNFSSFGDDGDEKFADDCVDYSVEISDCKGRISDYPPMVQGSVEFKLNFVLITRFRHQCNLPLGFYQGLMRPS